MNENKKELLRVEGLKKYFNTYSNDLGRSAIEGDSPVREKS